MLILQQNTRQFPLCPYGQSRHMRGSYPSPLPSGSKRIRSSSEVQPSLERSMYITETCSACHKPFQRHPEVGTSGAESICFGCALRRISGVSFPDDWRDVNSALLVSGEISDRDLRELKDELRRADPGDNPDLCSCGLLSHQCDCKAHDPRDDIDPRDYGYKLDTGYTV